MPRFNGPSSRKPKAANSTPRIRPAAMSVTRKPTVEDHAPDNEKGSTSLGASSWPENPWADVEQITTRPKRGPTFVDYCSKPGQFWPDGQEPPFKGQKAAKRIFVTKGKTQLCREITKNYEEIKELKNYVPSDIFHPRTGDIELYYDYSDYDGTDEEDLFGTDEDDAIPPPAVAPIPPPTVVPAPPGVTETALDPEDLDLLLEIMDIPKEVSSMLLPSSDAVNVRQILKFTLPDVDDGSFAQAGASCFDSARPNENLDLPPFIPPKPWVYSLRESLDDAICEGKRSIVHPQLKDQPLPLWMLSLWEKLHAVRDAKMSWQNADRWLSQKMYDCDMNPLSARQEMYHLPYHKKLAGQASTSLRSTLQLARFLSDDAWLSDSLVDMMMHSTIRRLVPNQSNLVIIDTELADAICMSKPNFDSLPNAFKKLEQALAEGKILFFPVCIPGMSHFVAFRIDFKRKALRYGDSLNLRGELGSFIQKLQRWLTVRFHGPFEDQGNTLPHGIQQDSISCRLFCVNTIAHNVFGDPLGVPDHARAQAKWFQRIAYEYITAVPQEEIPTVSMSDMVVGPPPPPSTSPGGLPQCQTETEQQKKEKRKQLIPIFKEKADAQAADVAWAKKEMEMEEQKEIDRKKEVERQKQLEIKRQMEVERQLEIERQKQLEIERQQEVDRQRDLEIKRQQDLEIERQKEADRQRELEHQRLKRVQKADSCGRVVTEDSMDVDIEPGEVTSGSHAPSPNKGKTDTVNRRDRSPRCTHAPFVPNCSRCSLSPPPRGSPYHPSRREPSPPRRPSSYRDYAPSQSDRRAPPRRYRSPPQEHSTRRGRSPLPGRARGSHRRSNRQHSPVRRSYRALDSCHPSYPTRAPSTNVPAAQSSIPGTLSLPMGYLQFLPSSTVTSVAGLNMMGCRPANNTVTHFILDRTNCLAQYDDLNPLSPSLRSDPQNRLLHIACYPPYHLLHTISRGRLVVSKRTEIRLRLWRAQYPDVPLWFFAIRCLSRGMDWWVFANPQHLVGLLSTLSGPRPAYLDQKPLLLTRGNGEFERYENSVRDMLRLPFSRRFCGMGGLLWRLAIQFGPDNLISAALSGPSSDASMHSNVERIGTDVDDMVTDAHINTLLGLTDDNHILWPPIDVFDKYMQWQGEWMASLETWFMRYIAAIKNRDSRAFAPHSQWISRLGQHTATSFKDAKVVTEGQAELLCYDIDRLDPRSFAALD
ncbi:hypothetical protein F4604DRAFT_1933310 [Suillus subluteus]|nr:hypothetical protein F4604DRAFT_1933310 [Suillus subluteus]